MGGLFALRFVSKERGFSKAADENLLVAVTRSVRIVRSIRRSAVKDLPAVAEVAQTFGPSASGSKLLASSATGRFSFAARPTATANILHPF